MREREGERESEREKERKRGSEKEVRGRERGREPGDEQVVTHIPSCMSAAYLHVTVESLKTVYLFAESIILVCEKASESAGTLQLVVKMHGQGKSVASHCPTSSGLIIKDLVKLSDDWVQLNTKRDKTK